MSQAFHTTLIRKRWQAWAFIGTFGALLLGFGASNILAWHDGGLSKTLENGWHGFADGKPMQALAEDLRKTPLADWLGQRQREMGWLVFNDLGARVQQGCPGWLFLSDELKPHRDATMHAEERARVAIDLQRALEMRGSKLVVALVPDKTRIEADHRCDLPRPSILDDRYHAWLQSLTDAGVTVVDLGAALSPVKQQLGAAFDRTDTHWRIEGAQAAANAIADRLKARGFAPASPTLIKHHLGEARPRWGDLVRLAGLDKLPESWRPDPDQVPSLEFAASAQEPSDISADALFGDATNERVALVGTSFSRNAHFADFLAEALQSEIGNFARDGGGFAQSMSDFLEQEAKSDSPTPWVIWEIPERVLQEPLQDIDMALLAKAPASTPHATSIAQTSPGLENSHVELNDLKVTHANR